EPPALGEGGEEREMARERGDVELLLQSDLEMMAGHGLVQDQRRNLPERPLVQLRQVYIISAGDAALRRTLIVISGGCALGDLVRDRADRIGEPRQAAEQAGQMAVDLGRHPRRLAHQLLASGRIITRVGSELPDEGLAARKARLARDLLHLRTDPRHLAQADIVDLLRGEAGGGLLADLEGVE